MSEYCVACDRPVAGVGFTGTVWLPRGRRAHAVCLEYAAAHVDKFRAEYAPEPGKVTP